MNFQNHFGLDIGSHSIKVAQLAPQSADKFRLVTFGEMSTPEIPDSPEKKVLLAQAIKKFLGDSRISVKQVAVSLPENQVYTRVIEMPFLEEPELSSAIHWQAEQYIPVPLTEVTLKHEVIAPPIEGKPDAKMKVLLVAAPNTLINNYLSLLSHAGLEVVGLETEIFAVSRSLVGVEQNPPATLLVNLGQETTILAILVKGELVFTQSIGTGGLALTRAVSTDLGLEMTQAEGYKKTYGLDTTKVDGRVAKSIKPVLDVILTEIRRSISYHETHQGEESIKRVLICGGSSLIPGLIPYITESLGLESQIGNPFANITLNDQQVKALEGTEPLYTTAVGLALKST